MFRLTSPRFSPPRFRVAEDTGACANARALRAGLLLILFVSLPAFAEEAPSVEQQFASYHQNLSEAADVLLTTPTVLPKEVQDESIAPPVADNFSSAMARVQQLRPLLEPILREEGLPADLVAVVLVESGGKSTALSPRGARGLWQLMPETARRYGLSVSPGRDERLDPIKATRAAAAYLRDLHRQFGEWQLAFGAYNAGEQTIQRARLRTNSSDFHRLYPLLPRETRAYIPAVLTARSLFRHGHDTSTFLIPARNAHVLYASARLEEWSSAQGGSN